MNFEACFNAFYECESILKANELISCGGSIFPKLHNTVYNDLINFLRAVNFLSKKMYLMENSTLNTNQLRMISELSDFNESIYLALNYWGFHPKYLATDHRHELDFISYSIYRAIEAGIPGYYLFNE